MRLSALLVSFILLAACSGEARLRERKAYWDQTLSVNVPPGTSTYEFSRWLWALGFAPREDKRQHVVSATVEEVPNRSRKCTYTILVVRVFFDDTDRSVRRQVDSVGTCL